MITYNPKFLMNPDKFFELIKNGTPWERIVRDGVPIPRSEHWCNDRNQPYTYGSGDGRRTYEAKPWTLAIMMVRELLYSRTGVYFEGCFSNYYLNGKDHLYWHSDDDEGIDHSKPIAVVTVGAEREIWFRKNGETGNTREAVLLNHGSLLMMPAGFQQTHQHRIPKSSVHNIGERISLTFRSLL